MIEVCISGDQSKTLIMATEGNGSTTKAKAVITHPKHKGMLSECHNFSLEVYRGRQQAIEISHDGFAIIDNENYIEVSMHGHQ